MPKVEYYITLSKQKFQIKVYSVLCLILVLVLGFYGYVRVQEYLGLKNIVDESRAVISNLEMQAATERANYESAKGEFTVFLSDLDKKLDNIFPVTDNYIVLLKQFDDIEDSMATLTNEFTVSNITFSEPVRNDTYSILPLRMSITSSLVNFNNFLRLVENSGDFSNETRLMEISSVNLSFPSGANTKTNDVISFTVSINAYFQ